MLDLGIIGKSKTDDYDTKFLNDLIPGEEISGEIYIGEIKSRAIEKTESYEFYVIITDDENRQKWVVKLVTSYYPDTGNIYGEKWGRVYTFIDSLNHVINNDPPNEQDNYSVNFKTFQKAVNDNVSRITVKAIPPTNPNAKYISLQVVSVQLKSERSRRRYTHLDDLTRSISTDGKIKRPYVGLDDLAHKNAVIRIAYTNLGDKKKDINVQNLAFELKSMKDREEIDEHEFKAALQKLDTIKNS